MDEKQAEIDALREKWIETLKALQSIIPLARVGCAVMQNEADKARVTAAELLVPAEWRNGGVT